MIDAALLKKIKPWLTNWLGVSVSEMRDGVTPVFAADPETVDQSFRAVRLERGSVMVANDELVEPLSQVVRTLHADVLFSTFGAYELARATLPHGVAVWGPTFHLFGDMQTLEGMRNLSDSRVQFLDRSDLGGVDYSVFWHCNPDSLAGFGVLDGDDLIALATVTDDGDPFLEIGMDVAPAAQRSGLGRAVVSTAATWILDQGKLVTATAAPFNSPSLRTLRSIGLRYAFTSMEGSKEPMRVGPQQLGLPLPDAAIYNHYPDWAMNSAILPKPD